MIGEVIDGRYRLDEEVGEGGMGVVYAATHVLIGKRVAMKVLRRDHASDHEAISRFMREAQLASSIKHPNVVDLSDFGQLPDGRVYYVMELLQGRSLADCVDHDGPMEPPRALEVATQIAKGLAAAHKHGIVHRDLKPDNVYMVDVDEGAPIAKLFDFGIARAADSKLTRPGAVLGTPEYMSPEQATGVPVDARADLYALGVIMMELLTCQVPFAAADIVDLIRMQLSMPAPLLSAVEPGLAHLSRAEALIDRLLQKDPTLRPGTAEEVIAALGDARAEAERGARRSGKTTHTIGSASDADLTTSPTMSPTMAWDGGRRTVGFRGGAWSRQTPIGTMAMAPPPGAAPAVGPKPEPTAPSSGPRVTEPQSLVHKPPVAPVAAPAAPVAVRPTASAPIATASGGRSTPPIVWVLGGAFVVALGAGGVLAVQALARDDTTTSETASPSAPAADDPPLQTPAAVASPSVPPDPDPPPVVGDPPPEPPAPHDDPPAPTSDDLPATSSGDFTPTSPDATDAQPAESKAAPRSTKKPKPKTTSSPATTSTNQDPPSDKPPPRTAPPTKNPDDASSTKSGGHSFELRDPFGRK